MTEAENPFSHPIAALILAPLSGADGSASPTLDGEAWSTVREQAFAALKTPDAEDMADALIEVVDFLEQHGANELAEKVAGLSEEIEDALEGDDDDDEAKAGAEFEGFDDDDEVEKTRGRRAAAKLLDKKGVKQAPQEGEKKPDGAVSLQSLIGTKRRM